MGFGISQAILPARSMRSRVIRAHQPGSEPIDIPETIPNPVVVPKPTPTPTPTERSQGASSNSGQGSLKRRPDGCDVRKLHPRHEQEACQNSAGSRKSVRLFKRIICDALFATKVQRKLSNSIAGFAAGGSSLDRQKSRQFARHLSDADHDQRMRKDARGMLARGPA